MGNLTPAQAKEKYPREYKKLQKLYRRHNLLVAWARIYKTGLRHNMVAKIETQMLDVQIKVVALTKTLRGG